FAEVRLASGVGEDFFANQFELSAANILQILALGRSCGCLVEIHGNLIALPNLLTYMACHVGEQIWERYQIPVYLYEAAATSPERQNLENIRRGQFELIREEILTNPARKPDFGECRLHQTAGACVVGARKFLIAYNIFLNTPDVDIAKKIAKAVRFSTGGLRFVKAAGFLV